MRLARNVEQATRALLPTSCVLFTVAYLLTCFFAMAQPQNIKELTKSINFLFFMFLMYHSTHKKRNKISSQGLK